MEDDEMVIVMPEAPPDDLFRGPEFARMRGAQVKRRRSRQQESEKGRRKGNQSVSVELPDILKERINCTVCRNQIPNLTTTEVCCHPVLKVLMCRKCHHFYGSGEFTQDSDGDDEQCRWCGQGGNLVLCDGCSNCFCKGCLRGNFSRNEVSFITDSDDWKCFVCRPQVLADKVEYCLQVALAVAELNKSTRRRSRVQKDHPGRNGSRNNHPCEPTSSKRNQTKRINLIDWDSEESGVSEADHSSSSGVSDHSESTGPRSSDGSETDDFGANSVHKNKNNHSKKDHIQNNQKDHLSEKDQIGENLSEKDQIEENLSEKDQIGENISEKDQIEENHSEKDQIEENLSKKDQIGENHSENDQIGNHLSKKDQIENHLSEKDQIEENLSEKDQIEMIQSQIDQTENEIIPDTPNSYQEIKERIVKVIADLVTIRGKDKQVLASNEGILVKIEKNVSTLLKKLQQGCDSELSGKSLILNRKKKSLKTRKERDSIKAKISSSENLDKAKDSNCDEMNFETDSSKNILSSNDENIDKTTQANPLKSEDKSDNTDIQCSSSDYDIPRVVKRSPKVKRSNSSEGSTKVKSSPKDKSLNIESFSSEGSTKVKRSNSSEGSTKVKRSKVESDSSEGSSSEASQNSIQSLLDDITIPDKSPIDDIITNDGAIDNLQNICGENSTDSKDSDVEEMLKKANKENKKVNVDQNEENNKVLVENDEENVENDEEKVGNDVENEENEDKVDEKDGGKKSKYRNHLLDVKLSDSESENSDKRKSSEKRSSSAKEKKPRKFRKLIHDEESKKKLENQLSTDLESSDEGSRSNRRSRSNKRSRSQKGSSLTPISDCKDVKVEIKKLSDEDEKESDTDMFGQSDNGENNGEDNSDNNGEDNGEDNEEDNEDNEDDNVEIIDNGNNVEIIDNEENNEKDNNGDNNENKNDNNDENNVEIIHNEENNGSASDNNGNNNGNNGDNNGSDDSDAVIAGPPVAKKEDKATSRGQRAERRQGRNCIVITDDSSEAERPPLKQSKLDFHTRAGESSGAEFVEESFAKRKRAKKRKRNQIKDSEDESGSKGSDSEDKKGGRRNIRDIGGVSRGTREAEQEEKRRRKRIRDDDEVYIIEDESSPKKTVAKLILSKSPLVEAHRSLVKVLKSHQIEGIRFLWNNVIENVKSANSGKGNGCILAHCMGLGKTLQVITFLHTVLNSAHLPKVGTALVLCPMGTVLNWCSEFRKWVKKDPVNVYNLVSSRSNHDRCTMLSKWKRRGGVMVCGYNLFRTLCAAATRRSKRHSEEFTRAFLDPGPDVVVCDEGHIIKNSKTNLSNLVNRIATRRRVVLTGTPLQNNLIEYHCMVSFIKPRLLGSVQEFNNRFTNPILNGQHVDSTRSDVHLMKKRSHVLHEMLSGCVQRKDVSCLREHLPSKFEYVLNVRLSPLQIRLYERYLEVNGCSEVQGRRGSLFQDFNNLLLVVCHPRAVQLHQERKEMEEEREDIRKFINDGETSEEEESSEEEEGVGEFSEAALRSKSIRELRSLIKEKGGSDHGCAEKRDLVSRLIELTKVKGPEPDWFESVMPNDSDLCRAVEHSGKLSLLLQILRASYEVEDKVVLFSQSLVTLDFIEETLRDITKQPRDRANDKWKKWYPGVDYFRMDGSTKSDKREKYTNSFNCDHDRRARLFLISTRAGGVGINLVGANRAVIFDASWNPSHDVQSIFRIYRFGQRKRCFVYRFIAQGTMEEKIYDRQVMKQSLAFRVVDEQQIERHFTASDISELYSFKPDTSPPKPHPVPADPLLATLLMNPKTSGMVVKFHEHDSLLDHQVGEELTDAERKVAWDEFDRERKCDVIDGNPFAKLQLPVLLKLKELAGFELGKNTECLEKLKNDDSAKIMLRLRILNPGLPDDEIEDKAFTLNFENKIAIERLVTTKSFIVEKMKQLDIMIAKKQPPKVYPQPTYQHRPGFPPNPRYPQNNPHFPQNTPRYPQNTPRYPTNPRFPANTSRFAQQHPKAPRNFGPRPPLRPHNPNRAGTSTFTPYRTPNPPSARNIPGYNYPPYQRYVPR